MRQVFSRNCPFSEDDFFSLYKVLSSDKEQHILLESGRGGRYSMIGINPFAVLEGWNDHLCITYQDEHTERIQGDPLQGMKQWMQRYEISHKENIPDFQGGAVGFITYDYVRHIERLPTVAKDDLEMPLLYFLVFDEVVIYDHVEQELWFVKVGTEKESAERWLANMERTCNEVHLMKEAPLQWTHADSTSEEKMQVSMTESQFKEAVEKIKAYIAQGDIFQVNLSVRQSNPLIAQPLDIYSVLRQLNPSPYMSYLHTPNFQVVSGSPELLVKKKGEIVSTRPIAGTRSRGVNAQEDERLANELMSNEKERAEHVMLVDLERNDLGRVCAYGSVEVNEFMVIEKYSHVMHIVSNVQGRLQTGKDAFDIIRATFPGGTITGAPKVRTMEIIEELEPVRRGLYTGSIGWIGFSGDMELNIVIRTLVAKDQMGHIQAGAGIVIDSEPKHEYKESLKKAAALWRAKEIADLDAQCKGEER
ncbi:MAG: anthranilate synthase component I [Bacillus sp. (in: firmicutes)]